MDTNLYPNKIFNTFVAKLTKVFVFRSSTGQTTTAGPYVNYNFRMIDAGSKESLMDLERRRRESCNSSVYNMENKEAVSQRGNTTR